MKDAIKITDEIKEHECDSLQTVSTGISQIWLGAIFLMAAFIGIWGFVCLVSGLIDGGLIGLFKGWLSAIKG